MARQSEENVVITDHAGDLPTSLLVLPEHHEFRQTAVLLAALGVLPGVAEAVLADLHRAVAFERVYLQGPGLQIPAHLAADVLLHRIDHGLPPAAESGLVVVELQVLGEERGQLFQIAAVVGVEHLAFERRDGTEQGLRFLLARPRLGLDRGHAKGKQQKGKGKELSHEDLLSRAPTLRVLAVKVLDSAQAIKPLSSTAPLF